MRERDALSALAAAMGIEPGYEDIWHDWHETSESAMRGVLRCMGWDVADAHGLAAARAALARARWQETLPPAIVRRAHEAGRAAVLRLPAARQAGALTLRLTRESGEVTQSAIDLHALQRCDASEPGRERHLAWMLPLPPAAPGYHRLAVLAGDEMLCEVSYVCAPRRCYWPHAIRGDARVWGPSAQLYGLRSERNWGIGDFTDLRVLIEQWQSQGAALVALNPLHALFVNRPQQASPYSPSTRLFLNVLYLDPQAIEDFEESEAARERVAAPAFQAALQALRATDRVDYAAVAQAKLEVLRVIYVGFRCRHLAHDTARAAAFRAFRERQGPALRRQALFEALQMQLQADDPSVWGWPVWPQALRDPASAAVAQFERERIEDVEFFEYLQWQADVQLGQAGRRALELQMGIGLYGDLAVSVDRGGGETWANQQLYALDANIGAPPDEFNMSGQNWGLPPWIPARLRSVAYAPFIAMLRQNMQHVGALRIDHVMGLMRLYWIPGQSSARDGAYVRYPLDDLLGILALESERNRCMVVGEDLGTVPDEVREALHDAGVLSYRLLYFERDAQGFYAAPERYPAQALVAASTHDLPTLAGFWEGRDVSLRNELGLFPSEDARREQVVQRAEARAKLMLMLEHAQLLPGTLTADPQSMPSMTPEFSLALHTFLARTLCKVMLVQLEDVLGLTDQANMPGTTDRHPNWQRRLPLSLEHWPQDERFLDLCATLRRVRGQQPRPTAMAGAPRTAVIPRATYRLQLNRDFTLADATALVPYLERLGVSHVYCSPYLRARPGSTHGYDIIDHGTINPEIGDEAALERFVATLHGHGMGQILDIVPNHMGVMGADNAWWLDVLENGQASAYAEFFDIDWHPLNAALDARVLVPVLSDHYGLVLERGELELRFDIAQGSFSIHYFAHRFPVDPASYAFILERTLRTAPALSAANGAREELESLVAAFGHLPPHDSEDAAARAERNRDKEVHKRRLAALVQSAAPLRDGILASVIALNGTPGSAASFDPLHELLDRQAYRLAYWRVASDEINYRRFFDINDLAALRMENEAVFEATHRRVLEWLREGRLDGLRIDHPDGLFDPGQYFRRLQARYAAEVGLGDGWQRDGNGLPLYLIAEKITAPHEQLPRDWALHGTTGYDFANVVNGLFVDPASRTRMERIYRGFTGDAARWDDVTYDAKRLIMRSALASELTVLTNRLLRLARSDRRTRDFTHNTLRDALIEVVACFPVYRTYVADEVSDMDRRHIDWAIGRAKVRSRAADISVYDFLAGVLNARPLPGGADDDMARAMRAFTGKLQQFTAPVTAKGVEDTSFYRSFPLASLNEVGGGPEIFGVSVKAFHACMQRQARDWPHTMLATSTHDTKRSEDVRLRIDALSEMPAAWRLVLLQWSRLNRRAKREVDGQAAPSRRDEYLLYQTLLGSVPVQPAAHATDAADAGDHPAMSEEALGDYRARIEHYMLKAVREAKLHTSWINVNQAYEEALRAFIGTLLGRVPNNPFLADLLQRAAPLARIGALGALSQALIKFTAPGVPDIYRGTETIDLSLVDPDNRRPVDYARLQDWLGQLAAGHEGAQTLLSCIEDGRAKLFVTWKLLAFRREHAELFSRGSYEAVTTGGQRRDHVCAFRRVHGGKTAVIVAPRLYGRLTQGGAVLPLGPAVWHDTVLRLDPAIGQWRELLSGRVLSTGRKGALELAGILQTFPVALLYAIP